jgi:hypothetical protein
LELRTTSYAFAQVNAGLTSDETLLE